MTEIATKSQNIISKSNPNAYSLTNHMQWKYRSLYVL